jgi:hypothetical protein
MTKSAGWIEIDQERGRVMVMIYGPKVRTPWASQAITR